jgi:dihydrofolate reductase
LRCGGRGWRWARGFDSSDGVNRPEIILVLARADNGVIGADGAIPWRLPADLRHFKRITKNLPMIMGRRTFDSLPGLLPGRRHIVLTRNPDWAEEGAEPVHSVAEALRVANAPHVAVIGGSHIYDLFLPLADRIELTEVHVAPGGDARIAAPDPATWEEVARHGFAADGAAPAHDFVTWRRRA